MFDSLSNSAMPAKTVVFCRARRFLFWRSWCSPRWDAWISASPCTPPTCSWRRSAAGGESGAPPFPPPPASPPSYLEQLSSGWSLHQTSLVSSAVWLGGSLSLRGPRSKFRSRSWRRLRRNYAIILIPDPCYFCVFSLCLQFLYIFPGRH